jgi:hypothetical protein
VNGARDRAYNVTIDGIEANESSVPNPVSNLYRITPDNIQEYKVTTNNATAEEGRNSGASISIATAPAPANSTAPAFFFLRNEALELERVVPERAKESEAADSHEPVWL